MAFTIEDVTVTFTLVEWGQLAPAQRSLYQEVMLETLGILVSLVKSCYLSISGNESSTTFILPSASRP